MMRRFQSNSISDKSILNVKMTNIEVIRAEFEANIEQHYPSYMASDWFSFDRRPDGIYEKIAVQCMWIGWQAART